MAKPKSELEACRERIVQWRQAIPATAARFHQMCEVLQRNIEKELKSWISDQGNVAILVGNTRALDDLGSAIHALLSQASQVRSSVDQLEKDFRNAGGPELAKWLDAWLNGFRNSLRYVDWDIQHAEDRTRINVHQETLRQIHEQITWIATASRRLIEATDLLRRIRNHEIDASELEALALEKALPGLEQRLYTFGFTPAWLEEIDLLVAPLRAHAERPRAEPPLELGYASRFAREAESWAAELGSDVSPLRELLHRIEHTRDNRKNVPRNVIQSLCKEAEEWRTKLRDQADGHWSDGRRRLLEEVEMFLAAVGGDQEIEARTGKLPVARPETPDQYRDYKERLEEEIGYLRSIATTKRAAIVDWIRSNVPSTRDRLRRVGALPMSASSLETLQSLDGTLQAIENPSPLADALDTLREFRRIDASLKEIEDAAQKDLKDLDARRAALSARYEALQQAASRGNFSIPDLGGPIADIAQPSPHRLLDQQKTHASAVEEQIQHAERQLYEAATEQVEELAAFCENMTAALRRMEISGFDAIEPSTMDTSTIPKAVDALLAISQQRDRITDRIAEAKIRLSEELQKAGERLQALPPERVAREKKQSMVEGLVEQIRQRTWEKEAAENVLEGLERLHELLERCNECAESLFFEENAARRLQQDLRKRLEVFHDEDLQRYAPETTEWVSMLIEGIPDRCRTWGAAVEQLREAERILNLLDTHTRRLAANNLESALGILERRRETLSAGPAQELERLLLEVEKRSQGGLPPPGVRRRVMKLAGVRGEEEP